MQIEFEGVVHDFPDDFTDDDIAKALAQAGSAAPTAPQIAAPERSTGESVYRGATAFSQGFNDGLTSVLELPYDAINNLPRLANLLPGEQNVGKISDMAQGVPVLGDLFATDDPLHQGADQLGLTNVIEPETAIERVLERSGAEVGASVVPQAALTRRAGAISQTIGGMNEANLFDRALSLVFRDAPLKTNLSETAIAASAGAGSGVAREVAGDDPTADFLGGLAGALGMGGFLGMGDNLVRGAVDAATDRPLRVAAGERLTEAALNKDAVVGNAPQVRANDAAAEIPGLRLSAGEASGDPGLLSLQYSRSTGGPNPGLYAERQTSNNAAMRDQMESVAPAGTPDDAATRMNLEARRDRALGTAESVVSTRQSAALEADAAATPTQSNTDAGRALRGSAERGIDRLSAFRDAEALPHLEAAEKSGVEVDASQVMALIDSKLSGTKQDVVRSALASARDKMLDPATGEIDRSIGGLYQTRRAINDLIEGKTTTGTEKFADSELLEIRKALDGAISGASPDFGKFLETYRRGSADVNAMREGATGEVLARDRKTGVPSIPDSEVAAQFWNNKSGHTEALQQFEAQLGGNKDARQALRDYALSDARKAAERDGSLDPDALDRWVKQNSGKLDSFPDLRDDLGSVAAAQRSLRSAQKRQDILDKGLTDPKSSTLAKYLDRETGAESMNAILASKDKRAQAKNLMRLIKGDDDAVAGARRAFFDAMDASVSSTNKDLRDNPLLRKDAFIKFMNKNDGAAQEILGADGVSALRKMVHQLDALERSTNIKPKGSSGSAMGVNAGSGLTLNSVLSRLYGVQRGVVSPRYVLSELAVRQINAMRRQLNGKKIDLLLDEALLDPGIAKTLMLEASKENDRLITKRMAAILTRFGVRTARTEAVGSEQPREDEE